jgi:hypothetical protein
MAGAGQTQIFLSEHGNDRNDGLTAETPVVTTARAKEIARDIKHPSFSISGSDAYRRRVNVELGFI